MIFTRYLATHIHKGAALVLLILVSISLFFSFIQELDDLGKGQYGIGQLVQYLILRIPSLMVDFMPLAALLGTILSLGNLASNSELIAFQSSGISIKRFIIAVVQAALVLALLSYLVADFVVPVSETYAKEIKNSSLESRIGKQSRQGVWIKDENNIVFIKQLYPDGNARQIEIYQLDDKDVLLVTVFAQQGMINEQGWMLQKVKKTVSWNCIMEDVGTFYEKYFQKTNQTEFIIENVVKSNLYL